jgi:hypothetical protein
VGESEKSKKGRQLRHQGEKNDHTTMLVGVGMWGREEGMEGKKDVETPYVARLWWARLEDVTRLRPLSIRVSGSLATQTSMMHAEHD